MMPIECLNRKMERSESLHNKVSTTSCAPDNMRYYEEDRLLC
jgi:hypothetical protein